MAVFDAAYCTARITALGAQLQALESSPVSEYQTDNTSQRMGVKYRKVEEITKAIAYWERKLAAINSKGGRALAVFRRGC